MTPRASILAVLLLALANPGFAAEKPAQPAPNKWEPAIARFEQDDTQRPFAQGGVVFTGSSSLAMWKTLPQAFQGIRVLNRAFGGSTLPEVNLHLDRTVLKHKPSTVVLFCGGNDLAANHSPEKVRDHFNVFAGKIHAALPKARIIYISIHCPPGRQNQAENTSKANALILAECAKDARFTFVDIRPDMLGPDGKPNPDMYSDPLHPSAKAYVLWAAKLRPAIEGMPAGSAPKNDANGEKDKERTGKEGKDGKNPSAPSDPSRP